MGIDIKAFIDIYPSLEVDLDTVKSCNIYCFGEIYILRDTKLFGLMAGVGEETKPLIAPRGIPTVSSWQVQYAYTVIAIPDEQWTLGHGESSKPRYCKRSQAEALVKSSQSKYLNNALSEILDADAHTFSWLTREELEQIRNNYQCLEDYSEHSLVTLNAIISLMGALDSSQTDRTRLVFWFEGGRPSEEKLIDKMVDQLSYFKGGRRN